MARRADPARIDEAREAATRNRLIGEHMGEATADAWLAAWAEQKARDGLERGEAYWDAGWEWIATERERRVRPAGHDASAWLDDMDTDTGQHVPQPP